MALPIYTHILNLKGLAKIFFKLSRPKGNLCGGGSGGVTVLNPKYPQLSSGDTTNSVYMYNFIHNTPHDFQVQAPEILNTGTLYLKNLTWFIHISDVETQLHTTVDLSKYDPEYCTQH